MKESKIVALALCAASLVGGGAYAFISAYQKDTTPPVLSAEKAEVTASIEATDEELKNGVVAVDKKDGNVSGSVMIDHIKKKEDGSGDFDITYVGFDHSSNLGKLTRTLHYTDYESPKFELSDALRFPAGKQINLLSYFQQQIVLTGILLLLFQSWRYSGS